MADAVNRQKMKEAIIIFVRNPKLGKVKTRLAAGIGIATEGECMQQTPGLAVGIQQIDLAAMVETL